MTKILSTVLDGLEHRYKDSKKWLAYMWSRVLDNVLEEVTDELGTEGQMGVCKVKGRGEIVWVW